MHTDVGRQGPRCTSLQSHALTASAGGKQGRRENCPEKAGAAKAGGGVKHAKGKGRKKLSTMDC